MFKKIAIAAALVMVASAAASQAPEAQPKATEGHCEKKNKDGTVTDIDSTDKADCKQKGGRWNKGKAHDDHKDHKDHKDGDHKEGEK